MVRSTACRIFWFYFSVRGSVFVVAVVDPVFLAVTISGTLGILIHAPYIFEYIDQEEIRKRLINSQDGVL